ncbi:hypothetical protein M2322_002687 [Rhodoblastus acidophilus]|uniref:portal protein n=1 Tax=Rhodoblastus acidophilus TaxID=1074 RepID=UPI0022244BC0|nr:hypothetical protein [Rhodoblastus acidophilus]
MLAYNYNVLDTNIPVPDEDGKGPLGRDPDYDLGSPAHDVYYILAGINRQQVVDRGREMSSLTIPSVMPPLNYRAGDKLPGNNQSVGALAVNNLASKIMFMAFPPGQPMCRFSPVIPKLQKEIDQDPELYAQIELALSQLEMQHRKKAATTPLATAWVGYIKLLLIAGNALWKHVKLECPTFHQLGQFVTSRDMSGHPMATILEENVRVVTLPKDVQELLLEENEELAKVEEWSREATIYSVCKFIRKGDKLEEGEWQYWEETEKGTLIPGTEVTTEYDDCPMWPGWCIPVYGQNWGRSYVEEYSGDFYILESNASALNDGAAMASLALTFVKPGARTSLRQVQKAKNLSFLSGSAEDITTFRTEKSADMAFVERNFERAAQRIAKAFLDTAASMRQGERVTAEEVQRTGQALDQAMGGIYTELAQTHQKRMVARFIHLNEEANKDLPALPKDLVELEVITGVDAMGRSADVQNLTGYAENISKTFPQKADSILDAGNYATRLAAAMGIKPDGLVRKAEDVQAQQQAAQQQAMAAQTAPKVAGAMTGPIAQGLMDRMQAQPGTPAGAAAGHPSPLAAQGGPSGQ